MRCFCGREISNDRSLGISLHFQLYIGNYDKTYRFDHVFSSDTGQDGIYRKIVSPVIRKSLDVADNAAILAYGQTGAGKTHTMGTNCTAKQVLCPY